MKRKKKNNFKINNKKIDKEEEIIEEEEIKSDKSESEESVNKIENEDLGDEPVYDLTLEEKLEIEKESIEEFYKSEKRFLSLLNFLISLGAKIEKPIDKLKKYRDKMNLEVILTDDKKNEEKIIEYDAKGLQNVLHLVMKFPTKKLIKFFLSREELNINAQDHNGRSPIHHFLNFNQENSLL